MKNVIQLILWKIDFYIIYFLYNPKKLYRYHKYMLTRWGKKYRNTIDMYDN